MGSLGGIPRDAILPYNAGCNWEGGRRGLQSDEQHAVDFTDPDSRFQAELIAEHMTAHQQQAKGR